MLQIKKLLDHFYHAFQRASVKDSLWMIGSRVISVGIQALYFIFVARFLGSDEYGEFIGVSSLVGIISPFVGFGHSHLLVRTVSRDRSCFRDQWGKALVVWGCSAIVGLGMVLTIARGIWREELSLGLVFWAAIADFVGVTLMEFSSAAFLSIGIAKRPAQLKIVFSAVKFLAVGAIWLVPAWRRAETWAIAYCIASVLPALLAFVLASNRAGWPILPRAQVSWDLKQGFYFAIAGSAETINANADKTLLSSLGSEHATGIYGAGYRFIDVGYQPIIAVGSANYARFFQAGASGIDGSIRFARRLLPLAIGYGVVAAIGMVVFAPVVPILLGNNYREAIDVLRWLAPIHFLAAMQYLAADSLTCSGHQVQRSTIQITAALGNIVLNWLLIPHYSWVGAAWATLASEGFKFVGLWSVAAVLWRRELANKQSTDPVIAPANLPEATNHHPPGKDHP